MAMFDNIPYSLPPNQLTHPGLELAHRRQSQHVLFLLLALCTLVLNGQVGQAGIGGVDQVQVSDHTLVPQYAVIAQPQLLLLVLDQHLNGPSLQVVGHDGFARSPQVVRNQSDILSLSPPTRENHLHHAKFVQLADTLGQTVRPSRPQTLDRGPSPAAPQDVPAVGAEFMLPAVDEEVAIRLAYTDKMNPAAPAGIRDDRAEIVRIEHDSRRHTLRQDNVSDRLGGQFRQLAEWPLQSRGGVLFEVQPRTPRDRHAAIPQADLQNSVAVTILACGVMKQFAYTGYLLCTLEGLRVVDDQVAFAAVFPMQPTEGVQGDLLNDGRFVPVASPEELSVVGSMGRAAQESGQSFNRAAMPDGDGHHQTAEMLICRPGKVRFQWMKKSVDFSWDFTDGNHAAIPQISFCWHIPYRQKLPHFFCATHHRRIQNRSV